MLKKILIITLLITMPFSLYAEEKAIESAYKLFETTDMKSNYKKIIENLLYIQIQKRPILKSVEKEMRHFFEQNIGWNAIKGDIAKMYAENYTAKELDEINAFYKTPVGQKSAKLMPKMAVDSAKIGQSKVRDNIDDLEKIIKIAMKNQK